MRDGRESQEINHGEKQNKAHNREFFAVNGCILAKLANISYNIFICGNRGTEIPTSAPVFVITYT